MKKEESLQISVCTYLRMQYPHVMFACDLSSGLKLTMGQAVRAKRMRETRGYPDLMIMWPNETHCGLMLELKREGAKVLKRNGDLISDQHIIEQAEVLRRFKMYGYKAEFAIGFDHAKSIIDSYLKNYKLEIMEEHL